MIGIVFYFYNVLQEFVYQHFSKKRNNKIKTVFQTFIIIIMELMDLIPKKAVMETNLAPILKTIYTWHCLKWPKSFIDDGFGVIKSNEKEFSKWVFEFNQPT